MTKTKSMSQSSQSRAFVETARLLGANEDEGHFKGVLRQIVRADVPPEARKKPKRKET